jgi:hypothetical protein
MSFQAYLDNIKAKTGKSAEDFKKLGEKKGFLKPGVKASEIVNWLKKDFDLGHGHAMAIFMVFKTATEPKISKDDAVDKHFVGNKSSWRKTFDGLFSKLKKFGDDVKLAPTNNYLNILNCEKKFAVVQITADRMDIGIKLKDAKPTVRFESAGSWNSMMTHRVRIHDPKEIDKELMGWLQEAYGQSEKVNRN